MSCFPITRLFLVKWPSHPPQSFFSRCLSLSVHQGNSRTLPTPLQNVEKWSWELRFSKTETCTVSSGVFPSEAGPLFPCRYAEGKTVAPTSTLIQAKMPTAYPPWLVGHQCRCPHGDKDEWPLRIINVLTWWVLSQGVWDTGICQATEKQTQHNCWPSSQCCPFQLNDVWGITVCRTESYFFFFPPWDCIDSIFFFFFS